MPGSNLNWGTSKMERVQGHLSRWLADTTNCKINTEKCQEVAWITLEMLKGRQPHRGPPSSACTSRS